MNRQEFMERLENLLQNIPEQERVEALQYYNDYFEDAGAENEQAVLDALGTPAQVAENIKRDLNQNRYAYGEETEKVNLKKEIVKYQPGTQGSEPAQNVQPKKRLSAGIIVLIVLLCILASPMLLGLLGGLLGILIGIFGVWVAVVFGFGAIALALLFAGVAVIIVGVTAIALSPVIGIGIIGGGFLSLAVGLLCFMAEVFVLGKLTPAVFKGIGWIFNKLTGKNKAV